MDILTRLPKLKASKDFESAITDAHAESSRLNDEIGGLEEKLASAYFEPSTHKPEDIRKEIGRAKEDREILLKLIDELELRRERAFQAEIDAEMEKLGAEARKIWGKLRDTYLRFDVSAKEASKCLAEIMQLETAIRETNVRLSEHKRSDLRVRAPLSMLSELIGRELGFGRDLPQKIQGYFPEHPAGSPFHRMKELKL